MIKLLFTTLFVLLISSALYSTDHFTESFTNGPSDYYTGSHTYNSGLTWELVTIRGEYAAYSVGGIGSAALFQANSTSSIISPSVNTIGSITFQYREKNDIGGGSFTVQKSVGGGAFVTIATQNFSGTTYQTFDLAINDNSSDIRIKIVASNPSTYLIVDELTISALTTDPELYISPISLSGFTYIEGSVPSLSQSYNISGSFLTGYPGNLTITSPTNYEISLSSESGYATSVNVPYTSATLGSTPIYVRLKAGLSVGTYNSEIITNSGGGATTVTVTCNGTVEDVPPPSLTVNPTNLNGFNYIVGNGPSAYQSYSIGGTYLTDYPGDITVTAPTNYEISLSSESGYTTNLNIAYSSATLSSTTIYVSLKADLGIGTYNSEIISNAGGGATTVNVTCNGSVTDVPPAVLTANPTTLSGFSYTIGSGPSSEQSYSLNGSNLTGYPGNIIVTAPTNYEISQSSGSGFTNTLNLAYTSATLTATTIYIRLKADLAVENYNSESIINSGGGAVDAEVICNGSVSDVSTEPCLAEDFSGFTSGTHESPATTDISGSLDTYTQTSGWTGLKIYSAGGEIKLGTSSANGYIITPAIDLSEGASLNFDYAKWGTDASVVQVFHAADGVNFVQIGSDFTPTTDFQSTSIEITGGTASSKIKIGTNVKRAYLDNINIYCGGSVLDPTLSANPTILNGFNYIEGSGPSAELSFTLTGVDLNGDDVTITPPANYEISQSSGTGYQSTPIVLSAYNGSSQTIYVRLKASLEFGIYNSELIIISGGGASDKTVTCNGSVEELLTPELIVNTETLDGFYYIWSFGPSAEQSFVLRGEFLDGSDVTINPTINYEISLTTGTGFQSTPIVISAFDGTETTVYVRLKAGLEVGYYNTETISITGGGATTGAGVVCNGFVDVSENIEFTNNDQNLMIYPNPVNDLLNIRLSESNSDEITWNIVSITGQVVMSGTMTSNNSVINISNFKSGMYILNLKDDQNNYFRKFNKE